MIATETCTWVFGGGSINLSTEYSKTHGWVWESEKVIQETDQPCSTNTEDDKRDSTVSDTQWAALKVWMKS